LRVKEKDTQDVVCPGWARGECKGCLLHAQVNRRIENPVTLSEARKGPVKASPEVDERRIRRREGPFRVVLKGLARIPEQVGAEPRVSGARFRAGECCEEGSIRAYRVLQVGVQVRDVVDSLRPREPVPGALLRVVVGFPLFPLR
jgi:hypothetical protein